MCRWVELPDTADADEVDSTEETETVSHFDRRIVNCDELGDYSVEINGDGRDDSRLTKRKGEDGSLFIGNYSIHRVSGTLGTNIHTKAGVKC